MAAERDELIERYLTLGLELGRHVEGFVDAYYGPPELAEEVNASAPSDPLQLIEEAGSLAADLADDTVIDPRRKRWLLGQVLACETVARRLAGEEFSWSEEVERCFGTRISPFAEERLVAAHRTLEDALPGHGPLEERYQRWLQSQAVPRDLLLAAAERLSEPLRRRAIELAPLPSEEEFEFDLVEGEPWSAFNYYLGDLRSRVVINADALMWSPSLTDLVAHELYPGHHTERVCKEALFVRQRGWLEETIVLVLTPHSLVAEGIATLALDLALGAEAHAIAARLLRPLGIPYDHETATAINEAEQALGAVVLNVAHQLHEEARDVDDVRDYARHWSLKPPELVDRMLAFAGDPTWRTYVGTYSAGLDLCRDFVRGDDHRFARLLTEQVTPDELSGVSAVPG